MNLSHLIHVRLRFLLSFWFALLVNFSFIYAKIALVYPCEDAYLNTFNPPSIPVPRLQNRFDLRLGNCPLSKMRQS